MSTSAIPAAALALALVANPAAASQAQADGLDEPSVPVAVESVAVPEAGSASDLTDALDGASGSEQETVDGASTEEVTDDVVVDMDESESTDDTGTTDDAAVEDAETETEGGSEVGADEQDAALEVEVEDGEETAPADCASCDASTTGQVAVTDGYQNDGHYRPFWWASDGLHFDDQIPANGYVNINVPGAQNVSIDSHRELIGATFIPWSYFGLEPGMCITWTESNGYNYHFGEDNSGRDGVNENGWQYCVPSDPEPGPGPGPEPEPTPDPTPTPTPDPTPDPEPVVPVDPEPVAPQPDPVASTDVVVTQADAVATPDVTVGTWETSTASEPTTDTTSPSHETGEEASAPALAMTGSSAVPLALVAAGTIALGWVVWGAVRHRKTW